MLQGYRKHHAVIDHIGDVKRLIALGNDEHLVGLVIVLAILDSGGIRRIDLEHQIIKTAVTLQSDRAGDFKRQRVDVMLVDNSERDVEIGVAHIGTFHCFKELLIEMISKFPGALRHRLKRDVECR